LEDPVENIGAKLVRQAAAKTNDLAGDGTTTSVVLAQGFIAEGVKVCVTFFFQLSLCETSKTFVLILRLSYSGGSCWCKPCFDHQRY